MGKERDAESGLDYFGARYYSSTLGRWISADWSVVPAPVPYADFADPQSLNLYSYVRNLPTTKVDKDGHCPECVALALGRWAASRIKAEGFKAASENARTGALKGAGQFALNTVNGALAIATPGNTHFRIPTPGFLKPSNTTQAQASAITQVGLTVASIVTPLIAGPAAASSGVGAVESLTVTHFTNDAGVAAITDAGGILRGGGSLEGTFVVPSGQIPAGATSSEVESLLEVSPGKGANSITFDTPKSNLALPDNGPTTSGGATQYRLNEPTKVDPTKFKKD